MKKETQEKKESTKHIEEKGIMSKVILRAIGIILAIFITIFIIATLRKFYILNTYAIAMEEYGKINNYHAQVSNYNGNNVMLSETYYKEGKTVFYLRPMQDRQMVQYTDKTEKERIIRIDSDGNKVAIITKGEESFIPNSNIISIYGEGMNAWQNFLATFVTRITTEECNGKQCYKIDMNGIQAWIDKETYLQTRSMNGSAVHQDGTQSTIVTDYKYEFGTVTEEQVQKPDLTGYGIKEE